MADFAAIASAAANRVLFAGDGAVVGVALAVVAVNSLIHHGKTLSYLRLLTQIPTVHIPDLLRSDGPDESGVLVAVRGHVVPTSSLSRISIKTKNGGALVANRSGQRAVIVKSIHKSLRFKWKRIFRRLVGDANVGNFTKMKESMSIRSVPFVLSNGGYIHVSLDDFNQELPLEKVYDRLLFFRPTKQSLWEALMGNFSMLVLKVGRREVEKILPVGKEITAVGICRGIGDGALEIEPCAEFPYFLSGMTKERLEKHLAVRADVALWNAVVVGTVSAGLLVYALSRNWRRLKGWWEGRRDENPGNENAGNAGATESSSNEEEGDVPQDQMCSVCWTRQKRTVFVPCGHLICCFRCAASIRCGSSPYCPLCRGRIETIVRVYI